VMIRRPGSAGRSRVSPVTTMSPTTGWWRVLVAVVWNFTLGAAHQVRNSGLRVDSSPTRVGQAAVVGVAACFDAHGGDAVAGHRLPLDEEVPRARIQEEVAGQVEPGGPVAVHVGDQRPAEPVGGHDVPPPFIT
jgi:hypothetical protein